MDSNTDDHDLSKVLDSVATELSSTNNSATPVDSSTSLGGFDTPAPGAPAPSQSIGGVSGITGDSNILSSSDSIVLPGSPIAPAPVAPSPLTPPSDDAPHLSTTPTDAGPLESIKQDALQELRPLVDKLNVSPEEKFDTYLLLIRSTDDSALIAPAHEAAKAITDEARRADALLDIIKEIDYLSQQKKN